jgi:hypothetical protein
MGRARDILRENELAAPKPDQRLVLVWEDHRLTDLPVFAAWHTTRESSTWRGTGKVGRLS